MQVCSRERLGVQGYTKYDIVAVPQHFEELGLDRAGVPTESVLMYRVLPLDNVLMYRVLMYRVMLSLDIVVVPQSFPRELGLGLAAMAVMMYSVLLLYTFLISGARGIAVHEESLCTRNPVPLLCRCSAGTVMMYRILQLYIVVVLHHSKRLRLDYAVVPS